MAKSNISDLVLVESAAARLERMEGLTNDRAAEIASKAKAIVFAMVKGSGLASTAQAAEFYEVSEEVVRQNVVRNRSELESDGLKVFKGKELKDARDILSLASKTSQETVFTPRAFVRLGMLLRDSDIAKEVRTLLLDGVGITAAQSDRIRELELLLKVQESQERVLGLQNTMLTMHGQATVLALAGKEDQVVEIDRPTTEVIDERHNIRFSGQTLKQVAEFLHKRHGLKVKSGADVKRLLQHLDSEHLIAQTPRSVIADYIPDENLKQVYDLLTNGTRQKLLGE